MLILSQYCLFITLLAHFCISAAYKYVRPQDYLCRDNFDKSDPLITLGEDRDSAAIITQLWNSKLASNLKYDCHFQIATKDRPKQGLYTLITKLKFRRDPRTNACYDYIEFTNGNRWPSEKICSDISSVGPSARILFDERESNVSVHVYIDKHRPIVQPLELNMVITSHSECKNTSDFLCDSNDPQSCISQYFVRDNITNCIYPCKDENNCFSNAGVASYLSVYQKSIADSRITDFVAESDRLFGIPFNTLIYKVRAFWHNYRNLEEKNKPGAYISFITSLFP